MPHRGIPGTDGDGHWPFITSEPRCLLMPFLAQSSVLHESGPRLYPSTLQPHPGHGRTLQCWQQISLLLAGPGTMLLVTQRMLIKPRTSREQPPMLCI